MPPVLPTNRPVDGRTTTRGLGGGGGGTGKGGDANLDDVTIGKPTVISTHSTGYSYGWNIQSSVDDERLSFRTSFERLSFSRYHRFRRAFDHPTRNPRESVTESSSNMTTTGVVVAPTNVGFGWPLPVGIVAAILLIGVIALIVYCCCRRKRQKAIGQPTVVNARSISNVAVEENYELEAAGIERAPGPIIVEQEVASAIDVNAMEHKSEETIVAIPLLLRVAEIFESEQGSEVTEMMPERTSKVHDVERATQMERMGVTPAVIDRCNEVMDDNQVPSSSFEDEQAVKSEEALKEVADQSQINQDAIVVATVPSAEIDSKENNERSSESHSNAVAQRVKEYECLQAGAARYYETCLHGFADCGCLEKSHRDVQDQ